jgi:hypothetical protein
MALVASAVAVTEHGTFSKKTGPSRPVFFRSVRGGMCSPLGSTLLRRPRREAADDAGCNGSVGVPMCPVSKQQIERYRFFMRRRPGRSGALTAC